MITIFAWFTDILQQNGAFLKRQCFDNFLGIISSILHQNGQVYFFEKNNVSKIMTMVPGFRLRNQRVTHVSTALLTPFRAVQHGAGAVQRERVGVAALQQVVPEDGGPRDGLSADAQARENGPAAGVGIVQLKTRAEICPVCERSMKIAKFVYNLILVCICW
jgi:hypothetical protein